MASIDRSGREFTWNVTFTDIHPDFRARSGFITRAGDTQLDARMTVNRFGRPGAILEQTSITAQTQNFFDHNEFWSGSGLLSRRCRSCQVSHSGVDGLSLS